MFKLLSDITSDLETLFLKEAGDNKIDLSFVEVRTIIQVELLIGGFLANFSEEFATIDNTWSFLPNHKEVLPAGKNETMLEILRIYFAMELTLPSWRQLIRQYLRIRSELRIYQLHEKQFFYQKSSSICKNRYSMYQQLLTPENIQLEEPELPPFLEKADEKYYYYELHKGKKRKKYPITNNLQKKFPSHLVDEQEMLCQKRLLWKLPSNRVKVDRTTLSLPLTDRPWNETANEIDEFLQNYKSNFTKHDLNNIRNWLHAQGSFQLLPTSFNDVLEYNRTVNIAGVVGAGKSTMLTLEIARLKQKGVKSGIITVNVVDTLLQVYRLYLVGIKAVPLIGKRSSKYHLKQFIKRVKNESKRSGDIHPLSQLAIEYVLQFFDGPCLANVLAEGVNDTINPCTSMRIDGFENEKIFTCPLFTTCGKYTLERQLKEADVWVGTLSAFIHTKPLEIINPFKRTYAELAYDELDVMFIDEADSVQENCDTSFLAENKLFGEADAIFEKNLLQVSHYLDTRYDYSSIHYSQLWRLHTGQAHRSIHLIFELIQESEYIRSIVKNRSFGIHQIMEKITKSLFDVSTSVSGHPFFRLLNKIDFKMLKQSSSKGYDVQFELAIEEFINNMAQLKRYDYNFLELKEVEQKETKKLLELFMKRIFDEDVVEKSRTLDEERSALLLFRFFVYHLYFDYNFKYLISNKKTIEVLFHQTIDDIYGYYYNLKRYLPFLPAAPTGRNFQYLFKEGNVEGSIGTFRTYDYLAIGRDFLTNFGSMYEKATKRQGPVMCFMSGTSFAEGSLHYHVDIPLDYLLLSTNPKKSKIEQFLYPVYENGKPIFISGVKNKAEKVRNLKLMADQLVPKIQEELALLKQEKRIVALVVNSYEQAKVVQKQLEKYFPGKVKALANELTMEDVDQVFLRGEVEFFAESGAEILIVPLLSINRGYNILKSGESESLFGSIFFLIRPYIPGDSIDHILKMVNGSVPYYANTAKQKGLQFYEGVKYIRMRSNMLLNHLLLEENEWSFLDEVERKTMAWYMFVNVWQMIGRLLRGQTDARVFYVDAPFAKENALGSGKKETLQSSMLRSWVSILEEESSNPFAKHELYGEFLRGLKEALNLGGK